MSEKLKEIPEKDYKIRAIRSSGPGGQHVNKVATAIQLIYSIKNSSLTEDEKKVVLSFGSNRITAEGNILISAKRYRSQLRNRADAVIRLRRLITEMLEPPKPRKSTKPPKSGKEKRLKEKSKRSDIKKLRGKIDLGNKY